MYISQLPNQAASAIIKKYEEEKLIKRGNAGSAAQCKLPFISSMCKRLVRFSAPCYQLKGVTTLASGLTTGDSRRPRQAVGANEKKRQASATRSRTPTFGIAPTKHPVRTQRNIRQKDR